MKEYRFITRNEGSDFEVNALHPPLNIKAKGVYILYDESNQIIYVGQGNVYSRLTSHKKNIGFDRASVIFVENKRHRLALESLLIKYLSPLLNKTSPAIKDTVISIDESLYIKTMNSMHEALQQMSDLYDLKF